MKTIYFLRAGHTGPIKIGITSGNYQIRIAALQPGCPWPIHSLGSIQGTSSHEQWLHRRFAAIRMAGEWFEPTDELLLAINEILSPSFTWPATLTVRVLANQETKELIDHVDEFLSASGLTAARFGIAAIRDPNLVRNLRNGRELRFSTAQRVRDFIASHQKESAA